MDTLKDDLISLIDRYGLHNVHDALNEITAVESPAALRERQTGDAIAELMRDGENNVRRIAETLGISQHTVRHHQRRKEFRNRFLATENGNKLDQPIEVLDMQWRVRNTLRRAGITTVREALSIVDDHDFNPRNFSGGSRGNIRVALYRYGVYKMDYE